jgi:hypothetical protein
LLLHEFEGEQRGGSKRRSTHKMGWSEGP